MPTIDLNAIVGAADADLVTEWNGRELRFRMFAMIPTNVAQQLEARRNEMDDVDLLVEMAKVAGCDVLRCELETMPPQVRAFLFAELGKEVSLGES